jgi:hypothetical protein
MMLASLQMSGKEWLRVGSFSRSIALLVLVAGCSSSSASGFGAALADAASRESGSVQDSQDGAAATQSKDASTGSLEASAPPAPGSYAIEKTFAGAYAGRIQFRRVLSVGSLGSMAVLVSIYATVAIADDSTHQTVTLSASACHADTTGTGTGVLAGSTPQIPDVVMTTTHLDPVTFSASGSGTSQMWSTTELHGPIGWMWSSPSDAVPTSAKDPRVFDQDGDGMPGVTMNVLWQGTTTPVDFVQTERDSFSGTVGGNGDLVGTTADSTEQNVISGGLAGAPITSADDPNTADNTVRFVRVPSSITCAQLMAQAGSLFPVN